MYGLHYTLDEQEIENMVADPLRSQSNITTALSYAPCNLSDGSSVDCISLL